MIDLTAAVLEAGKRRCAWDSRKMVDIGRRISEALPGATFDWDDGSERWARVQQSNEVVAVIHGEVPFALARADLPDPVKRLWALFEVTVAEFAAFERTEFGFDPEILIAVLGTSSPVSAQREFEFQPVAAADVWIATIG